MSDIETHDNMLNDGKDFFEAVFGGLEMDENSDTSSDEITSSSSGEYSDGESPYIEGGGLYVSDEPEYSSIFIEDEIEGGDEYNIINDEPEEEKNDTSIFIDVDENTEGGASDIETSPYITNEPVDDDLDAVKEIIGGMLSILK